MKHINTPIHMNGYKVSEIGGGNFYAVNDNETVRFLVEGRNGGLYFKPIAVTRNTPRRAFPCLSIFVSFVRSRFNWRIMITFGIIGRKPLYWKTRKIAP